MNIKREGTGERRGSLFFPAFVPFSQVSRSDFRVPFTNTSSLRSDTLEQANSLFTVLIGHFRVPKTLTFIIRFNCATFVVKLSFICMRITNHFHIKGWAPNLVLIQRSGGTRKWRIYWLCIVIYLCKDVESLWWECRWYDWFSRIS